MAPFGIVKVEQGKALVISSFNKDKVKVSFTGAFVVPVIHKVEVMDISVKTIEIDRSGSDGLICCDNIRADIKVTFFVRVNKTPEDVIKVAQMIGCTRASDQKTLEALFIAKFSEALKTVGKQLDFVDLYTKREEFREQIKEVIGTDLNGYWLEDCAIDYLEQTPLAELDKDNILDAQGIRKITELTAIEHVSTNDFRRNEEKQIKKQDVEAAEAIYELERQQADAESKQKREIESVRAREQAETLKVQKEFNWCVDRLTYEKYGTKDPSKPGVYWMTPQEASAMTNAVGNASTQYVKTKVPADARAWVDTFAKESRELSKQNPAGSSWIEKIDCSKYASKIQIK